MWIWILVSGFSGVPNLILGTGFNFLLQNFIFHKMWNQKKKKNTCIDIDQSFKHPPSRLYFSRGKKKIFSSCHSARSSASSNSGLRASVWCFRLSVWLAPPPARQISVWRPRVSYCMLASVQFFVYFRFLYSLSPYPTFCSKQKVNGHVLSFAGYLKRSKLSPFLHKKRK